MIDDLGSLKDDQLTYTPFAADGDDSMLQNKVHIIDKLLVQGVSSDRSKNDTN